MVPGLSWTLPCPGGMKATAAQLQHRVPCWGYVFQEPQSSSSSSSSSSLGRKVVLLGDTCQSDAILGGLHLPCGCVVLVIIVGFAGYAIPIWWQTCA